MVVVPGTIVVTCPAIKPDAVPVKLVAMPEVGVPRAPLNSTGAPAVPTLLDNAVATPVPNPVMPNDGTEVAAIVPEPEVNSEEPEPRIMTADVFVPVVIEPNDVPPAPPQPVQVPVTVIFPNVCVELLPNVFDTLRFGIAEPEVPIAMPASVEALMVPDPEYVSEAPLPTFIAAVVFVPLIIELKGGEPPPIAV